jgi:hypothetical protein
MFETGEFSEDKILYYIYTRGICHADAIFQKICQCPEEVKRLQPSLLSLVVRPTSGSLQLCQTKDNSATLLEIEHTDTGRHVQSSATNTCYLR